MGGFCNREPESLEEETIGMKKKILVFVLSNLKQDSRVKRQILALKDQYAVTVVCFDADVTTEYEVIQITPTRLTLIRKIFTSVFLILRIYPIAYRILHNYHFIVKQLSSRHFDLIIANDVETLPLAFSITPQPKIVFDAHEYAPRHFEDKIMWRIFFQRFNTYICKKYIPRLSGMMTVGKGLASEYEKNFGVRPIVVTNANHYFDISPSKVSENKIRLVHHGIATPSRKLELMIDMMKLLDHRFTLDMILLTPGFASKGTRNYIDKLKEKSAHDNRIKILPAVASAEVVKKINDYDMGVFLLPPINFNYENTLPNKLFDFIQARLGIAIGPTPEMEDIVNTYRNGVVSNDFTPEGLAIKLNALTKNEIEVYKINSEKAAKEFNAEKNNKIIFNMIEMTVG